MKLLLSLSFILSTVLSTAQLSANIQTIQSPSSPSACDGWVHIFINSGTPPYTYIWDNLDTTNGDPILPEYDTLWNVCSGIYEFTVVDANNDSVFLALTFASAGYTWSSGQGTPQDTAYLSIENCDIDYGLPIDDAYLHDIYYVDAVPQNDSLFTSWAIVQGQDTTFVTDTAYHILNANNIMLDAGIYCDGRVVGTIIQIKHITPSNVGVTEFPSISDSWSIYPNPISEHSVIEFKDKDDKTSTLLIYTAEGKLVQSINVSSRSIVQLPYNELTTGMYLLIGVDEHGEITGRSRLTK